MQNKIVILVFIIFLYSVGFSAGLDFNVISDSVKCFGESTGKITINILSGNPDFIIRLYDKKPSTKQKYMAQINTKNTVFSFGELPANTYYITVHDSEGNYLQKTTEINQPDKLKAEPISIEKCFSNSEKNDAVLRANCTGGTGPYSYQWSENAGNQTTQLAENITRGTYRCIINDKNNCETISATIFFNEKVYNECFSNFE